MRFSSFPLCFPLLLFCSLLLSPMVSQAATVTYEFTGVGTSGDANVPTSSDLTLNPFARTAGLSARAQDDIFSTSGFPSTDPPSIQKSEYVSFSLSPISADVVIESLAYDAAADGGAFATDHPIQVELFVNGALEESGPVDFLPNNSTVFASYGFDFADVNLTSSDTAEFRFYADTHFAGRLRLDNVALTFNPVPEPGTAGLLAAACAMLAVARRKRRTA